MSFSKRIVACLLCLVITFYSISSPFVVRAGFADAFIYSYEELKDWLSNPFGEAFGGWNVVDYMSKLFQSNKPQNYYTTPSSSVEDQYGNVTNYYRGGDTTNVKILDSFNHTFNTIHNTTNLTNNYSANVKLSDFLNSYTTNNYDYTYNTEFKSWYYDQSTQNYTYDASQTYYNTDNSRYYISIDNSTDEYYLVDIQYSPTFVTVNYNYNGSSDYGDVTNVYYFELTDGRNSSTLSVSEILGLDLCYDVVNYEMVADDPNVLSLQHFDGSYVDSSVYHRDFYSVNRSTTYVDSGAFGKAVKLVVGSSAGVTIPDLSDYESLMIDFRLYYLEFNMARLFLGDTEILNCIKFKFTSDQCRNQWVSIRISISDDKIYYFVNGDLVHVIDFIPAEYDKVYFSVPTGYSSPSPIFVDELRISTGDMVSISPYDPATAPYDTNKVLALPDDPPEFTIYVRHSCPVSAWRIGGVRPSNPETGFFYIPIHADYTGAQSQIYDGNNWVDVDSVVVENGDTYNTLGYTFSPLSLSLDIDVDAKPGGSGSGTTSNCEHDWQRTESVDATCKVTGKVSYTCTKCNQVKTEVLPLVSHTWTVKNSVPTTYDDSGNILTEGYTIYRCDACGEEYKDTDGSGPPLVKDPSSGDSASDPDDDASWLGKIGQAILDFFDLIGKIVKWILDGILSLFSTAVELLNQVLDLFGAFGEALRSLWSWLPEEVITVLVAGVAVVVLAAIIKLFV